MARLLLAIALLLAVIHYSLTDGSVSADSAFDQVTFAFPPLSPLLALPVVLYFSCKFTLQPPQAVERLRTAISSKSRQTVRNHSWQGDPRAN